MPDPKEGGLAGSTVARVSAEQFIKQFLAMLVTLAGIGIDVRDTQPIKQSSPKLVTFLGKVIEVRDVQLGKHLSPKLVTLAGIVN